MRKKRRIPFIILILCTLFAALLGIMLPGQILGMQREMKLDQAAAVPPEYYSAAGSVMARNASAQMGTYQKMQLITGNWESERSSPASYELALKDYEAVELAREAMGSLYGQGLYPVNFDSDYDNWYVWEAVPYKAVDMVFHTYTAYYWQICFTKYDGSEKHTLYILENGVVVSAKADFMYEYDVAALKDIYQIAKASQGITVKGNVNGEELAIENNFVSDISCDWQNKSLLTIETADGETYDIVQAFSSMNYLFSIIPVS